MIRKEDTSDDSSNPARNNPSPIRSTPTPTTGLTFETALTLLRQGKRLRQSTWSNNEFLQVHDGKLFYFFGDAGAVSTMDDTHIGLKLPSIMACDWEVVS